MKILYAIQGTGNGHLSRAMEIAPHLFKYGEVDFLLSGKSAELKFPFDFKYKYHGLYFIFGRRGGIDYWNSIKQLKFFRLLKDIKACPVKQYDLIINDYEPISAWSSHFKKVPTIGVSHQASFHSDKVPRPPTRSRFFEWGMKKVAPTQKYLGLHYKAYDEHISIPVIRKEMIGAEVSESDHITVYLPSFDYRFLKPIFSKVKDFKFKIFSKRIKEVITENNVEVYPVNKESYNKALLSAAGVIIGSGFQGTSEALYLKKKMISVPMFDQYEQRCNAAALKDLGVKVVESIDQGFSDVVKRWIQNPNPCDYSFQPDAAAVADKLIQLAKN